MKKVYLIGAGTGAQDLLTLRAQKLVRDCDELYSTQRLCDLFCGAVNVPLSQMKERVLSSDKKTIGILVSGDTGFFSLAKTLVRELSPFAEVEVTCGISSLQYFCAKLGVSYESLKIVSLHGREGSLLGAVSYNPAVFALTGGQHKAHTICENLTAQGLGDVWAAAGENLSMPTERILKGKVRDLAAQQFEDLTVLYFQNPDFVSPALPLCDDDFCRSKVPMTKEEVRWISLAKLRVLPTDTVYDIGAGTGSVSIELARKACDGIVYAIEHQKEAVELLRQNQKKLKSFNLFPLLAQAPDCLQDLPKPDKVFIGGSGGHLEEILTLLLEKNDRARIVINAITLETLQDALRILENLHCQTAVTCINAARAKSVGGYHMMTANNPVYIITGERNDD